MRQPCRRRARGSPARTARRSAPTATCCRSALCRQLRRYWAWRSSASSLATMVAARRRVNQFPHALFDRRKRRRLEDLVHRIGEDRAILFARSASIDPFRIGHERIPPLLAVGERLPRQQISQLLIGLADERGPEAGLLDAVLVPQLESHVLKSLQQSR